MIVITTPTGRIGRRVVDAVLDAGVPVRVVVRDPARLHPRVAERLEVVRGSHDDVDVVNEALIGADAALLIVPPNPHAKDPRDHYLKFADAMCQAVANRHVERVVAVSSVGRHFGRDAGLLTAAFAVDEMIERSGVHYRSLRMPFFMENLLAHVATIQNTGVFSMVNSGDQPLATVATRDIADVAAALLLDLGWTGQHSVPVIGPDRLSPTEMADVMTRVLARPVHFEHAETQSYLDHLVESGMSEKWARAMVSMAVAQNDGVYDAEERATRAGHGTTPTTFWQWCHDELLPAVGALKGSVPTAASTPVLPRSISPRVHSFW